MGRRFDRDTPAEQSRAFQKPPLRFTVDAYGRKVRLYECPYCRDRGVASLPKYRREETDADLIRSSGTLCYAHPCPICKNTEQGLSGYPLSDQHKARLQRWRMARKAELETEAATDKGDRLTLGGVMAAARGVAEQVPALTGFEQNELAMRERKEKSDG